MAQLINSQLKRCVEFLGSSTMCLKGVLESTAAYCTVVKTAASLRSIAIARRKLSQWVLAQYTILNLNSSIPDSFEEFVLGYVDLISDPEIRHHYKTPGGRLHGPDTRMCKVHKTRFVNIC